ncbi:MAG: YndM family protein [Bacillus sp. (in: Bacteria)]|nr:YndM family protein [Bacillus sp. (in: firmicutes)]
MKHITAICIKLVSVIFISLIMLSGFFNYPFVPTIVLSIIIAGISYLLGDVGILRFSNNIVATLADLGLTTVLIWLVGPFIYGMGVPFYIAILTAVIISGMEYVYHFYVSSQVLGKGEEPSPQS